MRSDSALILFPGALGDFICFLPTLLALRVRHRGRMLVVAKPALLELVPLPGTAGASIDRHEVADLFASEVQMAPATRELLGGFDAVYSWTGFGESEFSRRLQAATGGQVQVFTFRGMQQGEHAIEYYARCAGILPQPLASASLAFDGAWVHEFQRLHGLSSYLLVHPGSGSARKNWQGFAALTRSWQSRHGGRVVLLRGPAESEQPPLELSDTIAVEGLSLPQVAAFLRGCTLYVGNDSGISHLAAAVGALGAVLFGPTDPAVWAPRSDRLHLLHAPERCSACGPHVFCLHRLSTERVIAALEAVRVPAHPR